MATAQQLEALFVGNADFDEIERSFDVFCPFEAIGMIRQEVRHAHFLQYCLDPQRPHGFGSECLSALMRAAAAAKRQSGNERDDQSITPLSVHLMDLDSAQVRREWRGIDLLIIVEDERLVVPIELKIDAGEHSGQLSRYRRIVDENWPTDQDWRHLFLFLTKHGEEVSEDGEGWLALPLDALARELDSVVRKQAGSSEARSLLAAYLAMLRRHHLSDENLESLAAKLWSQHREALEFLMDRQPGAGLGIANTLYEQRLEIAERMSKTSGLSVVLDDSTARQMRFAVKEWDALPDFQSAAGWTSTQRILLLEVATSSSRGSMSIRFALGPGPGEVRQRYYSALEDSGVTTSKRKAITGRWTRLATEALAAKTDDVPDEAAAVEEVIAKLESYAKRVVRPYHQALTKALL